MFASKHIIIIQAQHNSGNFEKTLDVRTSPDIFMLANPRVFVPMHYGLYPEPLTGTAEGFNTTLKTHRLSGRMTVLTPRTPWVVPH